MSIDKEKIRTQDEEPEEAPMDQVEERVEAEMDRLTGRARQSVAQGLQNDKLEKEGLKEEQDADKKLERLSDEEDDAKH